MSLLRNYFFGFLSTAIGFTCYAQQGNSKAANTYHNQPQFHFLTTQVYDFDKISEHSNVTHEFRFKNTGSLPLIITDMQVAAKEINEPNCNIEIKYPKRAVKPGKKGTIIIRLTAQDDAGSFDREIYVTSNATSGNFPLLKVKGAIIPLHKVSQVRQPDLQDYNNPGSIPVYPKAK